MLASFSIAFLSCASLLVQAAPVVNRRSVDISSNRSPHIRSSASDVLVKRVSEDDSEDALGLVRRHADFQGIANLEVLPAKISAAQLAGHVESVQLSGVYIDDAPHKDPFHWRVFLHCKDAAQTKYVVILNIAKPFPEGFSDSDSSKSGSPKPEAKPASPAPAGQIRPATLEVTVRPGKVWTSKTGIAYPGSKTADEGIAWVGGPSTVKQVIQMLVTNKRHHYRYSEHGSGCRFWSVTVLGDFETKGHVAAGSKKAVQEYVIQQRPILTTKYIPEDSVQTIGKFY